ncbi:MAG: hypothetical protein ACI4L9_03400, partial [Candidatus Coproplasma sp.]
MNIKRKIVAIVTAVVLALGIASASLFYFNFVDKTIYDESTAHLTEIYHQANQSLNNFVGQNWSS